MTNISPFSGKNGLVSGASGPLTLATLRPYLSEQLIALYEFNDLSAGWDFPNLFTDAMAADKDVEYVVRIQVGSAYASGNHWFFAQFYLGGTLLQSNTYWAYGNGFQNSTSAYAMSVPTSTNAYIAHGASNAVWNVEMVFPGLFIQKVGSSGNSYPLACNVVSKTIGYTSGSPSYGVWSCGPSSADTGKQITGLRFFAGQFGNSGYTIGKTENTGDLPIYLALYKRERALR